MAKKGNRHTVDQADLGFAIDQIAQDFRRSQTRPQDTIQFKDLGSEVVHGAASRCGEMAFVVSQEASPYYAPRAQICIEHTTGLPNRVRIWDDQNQLLEEYSYKNLRINVGLDDQDFDPNNTAYNF